MKDKQQHGAAQVDARKGKEAQKDAQGDRKKTLDTNSPRTRDAVEQVKVWEEEGGSPPQQISSTKSTKPKTEAKTGSMGPAKD